MIIHSIKTEKVTHTGDLCEFIDQYIPKITEGSILVITSKIISILEGSVVSDPEMKKVTLIKQEADLFMDNLETSRYGVTITIKNNTLIANAGIDESNANGSFILWPKDPFSSAMMVWEHLRKRDGIETLGVIVTDSRITPLRWGTIGIGLSWCGIQPLKNYIGTPDIFGRNLHATKASILDGLAASAVLLMGEGNEQTPLAIIEDIPFVTFTDAPPTEEEIRNLRIEPKDDLFSPLLTSASWFTGEGKKGGS